jgi:hypothetical protein
VRIIDSTLHRCLPGLGVGKRWLRERLSDIHVKIPLSDGCLQALVTDAEQSSWRLLAADRHAAGGYLQRLRTELEQRAELVHQWTTSDAPLDVSADAAQAFVRIARKYALPRPWKLTDPVAALCARPRPSYWRWASESSSFEAARTPQDVATARA